MSSPRVSLLPHGRARLTRSALGGAIFAATAAFASVVMVLIVLGYSSGEITEFLKLSLLWMMVTFFVSGPWYPRGMPMQVAFLIIMIAPLSGKSFVAPFVVASVVFALHRYVGSAMWLHHRRVLREVSTKLGSVWRRTLYGRHSSARNERDGMAMRRRRSMRAPADKIISTRFVRWLNVALMALLSWMVVTMPGVGMLQLELTISFLFVLSLIGVHGQPHVDTVWLQPRGVRRADIGRATVALMMRDARTSVAASTLLLVVAVLFFARDRATAVSALGAGMLLWAGLRLAATAIVSDAGRRGGMMPLIMFAVTFAAIVAGWRAFAWWLFPAYDERLGATLQQDHVHNAFLYACLAATFYAISEVWLRAQRAHWTVVDLAAIPKTRDQARQVAKRVGGLRAVT